jgi:hypothetical protein
MHKSLDLAARDALTKPSLKLPTTKLVHPQYLDFFPNVRK